MANRLKPLKNCGILQQGSQKYITRLRAIGSWLSALQDVRLVYPCVAAISSKYGRSPWRKGSSRDPSEQFHFHDCSRFYDFHVGGDLDVPVRLRHAGDVARCLECGHGEAVLDPH